ncbi:MAG: membrane protein insertion efficiency factor YidD [Acidimicrobiaceae bacterium]|nr:membrane protein insertion efficiency factor YidD [Acidimicrobiaceae bacterium]
MSLLARVMHATVRIYRYVAIAKAPSCRFVPSCSSYALESVEVHGAFRGGWLIVRRLSRCHPWGGSGQDEVPSSRKRGLNHAIRSSHDDS